MIIACVGDIHLIDPSDPDQDRVRQRHFFIDGQNSLKRLFKQLAAQQVDHIIFLGDIVDWVSPHNIAYAAEFLRILTIPWSTLPGNHDYQIPAIDDGQHDLPQLWQAHGFNMHSQLIDADQFNIFLVDNARGYADSDTHAWLDKCLNKKEHNIICQHVPTDLPEIRESIHSIAPNRNLDHYTCSKDPGLFHNIYQNRVSAIVSGHVHMTDTLTINQCTHYLCPLGIDVDDPGRKEQACSSALLLHLDDTKMYAERLFANKN